MHPISSLRCFSTLITYTDHIKYGDTSNVLTFSMIVSSSRVFLFPVERRTRLPCSTLEKARKTNTPFCPTRRAVRPMRTLSLGLDGRWNNTSNPLYESVVSACHVLGLSEHMEVYVSLSFRWIWLPTVGLWVVCREMAAQVAQHHITLPPTWRSSSMCRLACLLTRMTPSLKR